MNNDWYVAEPDGSTIGPMTRDAVVHAAMRRQFSNEAVAWHVDVGEWQPLARILLRFGRASQEAPARGQVSKEQVRDERQKQRELPVSQRTDSKTDKAAADRKRRVAATSIPGGLLDALAFTLGRCARRGLPLRAGMLVTTGAATGIHDIRAGSRAAVRFGPWGEILCRAVSARSQRRGDDHEAT